MIKLNKESESYESDELNDKEQFKHLSLYYTYVGQRCAKFGFE